MARVLVEVPRVGLVMETARLLRWLKAVGDSVAPGDLLAEIETEKAVVEIESAVAGKLVEILVQPEQEVAVGAQLAWVEDGQAETVAVERPAGRLRQEDASGATFTISNLGTQGPDWFTAILNAPESAILAVGRMRDTPVVRKSALTVRPISELALTVDHRMLDGRLAADFLTRLAQILEGGDWRIG